MTPPSFLRPTATSLAKRSSQARRGSHGDDATSPAGSPTTSVRGGVSHSTLPFRANTSDRSSGRFRAASQGSVSSQNSRQSSGASHAPINSPNWCGATLEESSDTTSTPSSPTFISKRIRHKERQQSSKSLINPAHGEVCYFGKLPPELRVMIYNLVLSKQRPLPICSSRRLPQNSPSVWPALLRVCRAIRHEFSYEFYSKTPFVADIDNNDFRAVMSWVERLPPTSRAHLQYNNGLVLTFQINVKGHFWFPDGNYASWSETRCFGNIYEVPDGFRPYFIFIIRLSKWFLWCGARDEMQQHIPWKYQARVQHWWYWGDKLRHDDFIRIFRWTLGIYLQPIMKYVRLSRDQKRLIVDEAFSLLRSLEDLHDRNGVEPFQIKYARLRRWLADV